MKKDILSYGDAFAGLKSGKPVGFCGYCGRTLTDPASVEAGIGPECAGKQAAGIPPKPRKGK